MGARCPFTSHVGMQQGLIILRKVSRISGLVITPERDIAFLKVADWAAEMKKKCILMQDAHFKYNERKCCPRINPDNINSIMMCH